MIRIPAEFEMAEIVAETIAPLNGVETAAKVTTALRFARILGPALGVIGLVATIATVIVDGVEGEKFRDKCRQYGSS